MVVYFEKKVRSIAALLTFVIVAVLLLTACSASKNIAQESDNMTLSTGENAVRESSKSGVKEEFPRIFIDLATIEAIKEKISMREEPWKSNYDIMISNADSALEQDPVNVTTHGNTTENMSVHDYWTEAPYVIDGVISNSADREDYTRAIKIGKSVRDLGLGYIFTGNKEYAEKAIELINVWCVNSDTRMTPKYTNMQSQIELSITMPGIFYGSSLIWNYTGWDQSIKEKYISWVKNFIESAKSWKAVANNNFENWRLVAVSTAAALINDSDSLNYAFEHYMALIPSQMDSDGKMLREVTRTTGLSYSLYAINAMVQTAEVARHHGFNLFDYTYDGVRGLKLALDYHSEYVINPEAWPYRQESELDEGSVALYEIANSFWPHGDYSDVIKKWERPLEEIRVMGPVSLTHGDLFNLELTSIALIIPTPKPLEKHEPSNPLKLEAEDMNLLEYMVEDAPDASSGARVYSIAQLAEASFKFSGETGTYEIIICYVDEDDGKSTFNFYIDNEKKDAWLANQSVAGEGNVYRTKTISAVNVENGAEIRIEGIRDYNELVRVDYIELVPAN